MPGDSNILGALAAPILGAFRNGSYPTANQQYPSTYQPNQPYQPLPPQQPYCSPQQSEQGKQEQDTQQEVEQQHQHV